MSAIIGRWLPPSRTVQSWSIDWLHGSDRWTSPRKHLAQQLAQLRASHGNREASEFRNYLLWLGCYPTRSKALGNQILD